MPTTLPPASPPLPSLTRSSQTAPSSSPLGSPVTPALRRAPKDALRHAPKDAALHLLCLAAEGTRPPTSSYQHSSPLPLDFAAMPHPSHHHHPHTPLPVHHPAHFPLYLPAPAPHHQLMPQPAFVPYPALPYGSPVGSVSPQLLSLPFPAQRPQVALPFYGGAHAAVAPRAQVEPVTPPPVRKVKGPWRPEEDRILTDLVGKLGARRWTVIASHIAGRTGKQARERWLNQLSPDLAKRAWTPEEDRIVMQAHAKLGNRWSEIAKLLKGRTDNATKNRFNTTIRRQISELGEAARKELANGGKKKEECSVVTSTGSGDSAPASPSVCSKGSGESVQKGRKRKLDERGAGMGRMAQRAKIVTASS